MSNFCTVCGKDRLSCAQIVHRELCSTCYRKEQRKRTRSAVRFECSSCQTNMSEKWYTLNEVLCRKCYRKKSYQTLKTDKKDLYLKERLTNNIRSRVSKIVSGSVKGSSAIKDLGCSIDELKSHLESKFQEEMSWDNYGDWHIDHIKPLSSFDLTDLIQFKQACHYTNLQPLWAKDNLEKGSKCG